MIEIKTSGETIQEDSNPPDLSEASIRSQLLWASLFPLAFFGLLTILALSTALYQTTLRLASQRNSAQVQVIANHLPGAPASNPKQTKEYLIKAIQSLDAAENSQVYAIDMGGNLIASSLDSVKQIPVDQNTIKQFEQSWQPFSQLMDSTISDEEVLVSFAPIPDTNQGIALIEPWETIMAPALNYQIVLVGLIILGTFFSLGMLSLGIGRVIRPITSMAKNASGAIPGSIFHPIPETGPMEIRVLINAFNRMVIRLADQQTALREYAHKTLLSQEEERQRLSHELHDGTLQDLIGLSQRVELCRSELENNPSQSKQRLDELHNLLEKTIADIRRISVALRPHILEDFGLSIALEALCKDLQQDKPGLLVEFEIFGDAKRLNADLELAVYRIVQESLTNIRKHAQYATYVKVELIFDLVEIKAVIKNNISTFAKNDTRTLVNSGHLGLAGMYERARLFGGSLNIIPEENGFTIIFLQLPYNHDSF